MPFSIYKAKKWGAIAAPQYNNIIVIVFTSISSLEVRYDELSVVDVGVNRKSTRSYC